MEERSAEDKKKRVSFAPEPQVMYIYPEESHSRLTESIASEDEISMELTVDHVKLAALQNGGGSFLDMDLDRLVGRENADNTEDCTQSNVSDGVPERVKRPRRSGDLRRRESFRRDGDSSLVNDTVNVSDIINTQDLRRMIPQARRETASVSELLVSKGIRFLDNLVVSNTRRDTMSKSRNEVRDEQVLFYENYIGLRTEFFLGFSEDLERRMKSQEKINGDLESGFCSMGTVFEREDAASLLRALKAECRMRAKIDWYELRKERELEFNQLVAGKKNGMVSEHNGLVARVQELEEAARAKETSNDKREEQISRIRGRVEGVRSECRPQKIEDLRELMSEQESVSENIRRELEQLAGEKSAREAERSVLRESLERVAAEIRELEKTLKTRNVTETQLKEMRQEFRTLCAVLGWEILRIETGRMRFRLMGYEFDMCLDSELAVVSMDVEAVDSSPLGAYARRCFACVGLPLCRAMEEIGAVASIVGSVQKELSAIRNSHEVECYVRDDELVIKVTLVSMERCIRRDVVLTVNGLECTVAGEDAAHSLSDLGVITRSIGNAYLAL